MTHQNSFDWSTSKILAVNAHPIGTSTREIEEAILIAVGQVTRPISTITNAFAIGSRVIPVTLKRSAAAIHNFAGGLF